MAQRNLEEQEELVKRMEAEGETVGSIEELTRRKQVLKAEQKATAAKVLALAVCVLSTRPHPSR